MLKIIKRNFYNQSTIKVAQGLLGKFLVIQPSKKAKKIQAMITETEAYCGKKDLACHSAKGRTLRTEVMFGPPGHAYVYIVYGMYFCLNVVTKDIDQPEAVLIRGVADINGPGKLCKVFKITKKHNGLDMTKGNILWIEDRGIKIKSNQIKKSPRIGIDYAGEYKNKKWRFVLNE